MSSPNEVSQLGLRKRVRSPCRLDVPISDPDLDFGNQSSKRYLSEMMSQGLRLRMSIDGSGDGMLDEPSIPAAMLPPPDSPDRRSYFPNMDHKTSSAPHPIFQPSPCHTTSPVTWALGGHPWGSAMPPDAIPANFHNRIKLSPPVDAGCRIDPSNQNNFISGAASPTDIRYSLNLRKAALLRSLLLRTDDLMSQAGPGDGLVAPQLNDLTDLPFNVWGNALVATPEGSLSSTSPVNSQLRGSSSEGELPEISAQLRQQGETAPDVWGMSRAMHATSSMRSDTINSSIDLGSDSDDDSDSEELASRRMSVHEPGVTSGMLTQPWLQGGSSLGVLSLSSQQGPGGQHQPHHRRRISSAGGSSGASRGAPRSKHSSTITASLSAPFKASEGIMNSDCILPLQPHESEGIMNSDCILPLQPHESEGIMNSDCILPLQPPESEPGSLPLWLGHVPAPSDDCISPVLPACAKTQSSDPSVDGQR
ncbi:hypothetical protein CEUSTIGMA_g1438.t1 [Chlamydomonas eustigma]|uniref:Uncharacterized protein n=1 Tax=Chlamydomonas eustigma TaxID=1157962 RepID=A0A250WT25_9CHLO|nr:hypothetical protein CEUSTIGMA_g1438.t1 [Chlamydomonas eustigma]|eukprot:GAX73988.1 hypothetical protein CEUSTIGMA_g1438.t1 [Chlamydomonas eustigma]